MTVDRSEVIRIAALAKLRLRDEEVDRLTGELNDVLEHCRTLANVDVSDEGSGDGSTGGAPERRPASLSKDVLGASIADLAPSSRDGFFLVPVLPALDARGGRPEAGKGDASGP